MAVLYQNNWDSATPGSTPPTGWEPYAGGGLTVYTTGGIGGTQSAGFDSSGNELYTGVTAFSDGKVSLEFPYSTTQAPITPGIRAGVGGGGIIVTMLTPTAGVYPVTLFRWNGGGADQQGATQDLTVPGSPVSGATIRITVEAEGDLFTVSATHGGQTNSITWTIANTDVGYPSIHAWYATGGKSDNFLVEDLQVAEVTYEVTGPSGGLVSVASTDFTISVTGDLLASTIFTPSDGGGGGTFTPSTVTLAPGTNPTGTFAYTPASTGAKTITVSNDGGLTQAPSDTYTVAALATAYTLTGPGSGTTGSPSSAFTITITGVTQSTIVFTPSSADGTFNPSTVSIGAGTNATGTFTYTPATNGTKTISVTDNGGLTDPSPVSYIAAAGPITVPVDSALLGFSPGNWDLIQPGTYGVSTLSKQTGSSGAYMKFQVSNCTDVTLLIDPTISSGITTAPILRWSIDDLPFQVATITTQTEISLLSGAASATRSFHVWVFLAENIPAFPRYSNTAGVSLTNGIRVTGVLLSTGAGIQAHPLMRTKKLLACGDSITDGVRAGEGNNTDSLYAYPVYLGDGLKAEYGQVGFSGQGWTREAWTFPVSWNTYSNGRPRDLTGFDYVTVCQGTNDALVSTPAGTITGLVTDWLEDARAGFGADTWLIILTPPGGFYAQALSDGVTNYKASHPGDSRVAFVSVTDRISPQSLDFFDVTGNSSYLSVDGLHPNSMGQARFGGAYTGAILEATIEQGAGSSLEPSFGFIG